MDHVAESNLNRQVQATHSSLGVEKGRALAARLADIAPGCGVTVIDELLTPENVQRILLDDQAEEGHTVWIDATDDLADKRSMAVFMANSKRLKDLVVSGGAGGKTDPTRVEASDLSESTHDALLSTLRYDLRKHCGFPRQGKMKIQTVFCRQMTIKMDDCDPSAKLSCAGYGSMVTVTASMGMAVAYLAISRIIES
jgi:tRNA A37 threonylcarbamoyladenosine dehydratase